MTAKKTTKPILVKTMSQEEARSLMLEYQSVIETAGATKIASDIQKHAKRPIERKTLDNWMKGLTRNLGEQHFEAVLGFIGTEFFKDHLRNPAALYAHEERIKKIGSALFDIYGQPGISPAKLDQVHTAIGGWWKSKEPFHEPNGKPDYFLVKPVTGYPFSVFVTSIRDERDGNRDPRILGDAAGLLFYEYRYVFCTRGWNFDWRWQQDVSFALIDDPDGFLGIEWLPEPWHKGYRYCQRFNRIDESEVDQTTRILFDNLYRSVIPRGIGPQRF